VDDLLLCLLFPHIFSLTDQYDRDDKGAGYIDDRKIGSNNPNRLRLDDVCVRRRNEFHTCARHKGGLVATKPGLSDEARC
ncbi:hypothetical protein DFH29DRAFT_962830, partial [Suillus ampliporus]